MNADFQRLMHEATRLTQTGDLRGATNAITSALFGGQASPTHASSDDGDVIEVDAPHRLAWTFAGEQYSFELTAQEGGCLLVFTHVFSDRTRAAQTAAGWDAYLSRLGPHLDGGFLSEEEAHGSWEEVHERYAASFGIDPAPGRRFIAAHRAAG